MSRSVPEANAAIGAVLDMPYGIARSQAAEQQVRLVEAEGPREALAFALATLVESLVWGGEVEKAFVPFTQHVRWWDAHPEHFDEQDRFALFWSFKWMVANLVEFPAVPAAQIDATLADMERRFALEGLGSNAVRHQRWIWADERGAPDAEDAFEAWVATPRDDFAQCEACEPGDQAAHLFATGRYEEGIRLLERTLAGSPTCGTEPADMLSHLALAYLVVGRDAEAATAHRRCLVHLDDANGRMEGPRGRVIELLARAGHDEAALRRLADEAHLLTAADSPGTRLGFLRHVGIATHLISTDRPHLPVAVASVPAATVAELDAWVHDEARTLARAFDRRNGTDRHERGLQADRRASRPSRVVPLSVLHAPSADDPAGTPTSTPHALAPALAEAEAASAAGERELAAGQYLAAAREAEAAGDLAAAGWALAEAAQCAHLLRDDEGASTAFSRALQLLAAADVPPVLRAPVARAAAVAAAAGGGAAALVPVVGLLLDDLAAHPDGAPDSDVVDEGLAARRRAAARIEAAHLTDTLARLLATVGDHAGAAREAGSAATVFDDLDRGADAGHAYRLVGQMHLALGDAAAAVTAFEAALRRLGPARLAGRTAEVRGELITALRAAGRHAEADAVTRT